MTLVTRLGGGRPLSAAATVMVVHVQPPRQSLTSIGCSSELSCEEVETCARSADAAGGAAENLLESRWKQRLAGP
jgi:hypothetical protein